MGKAMSGKRFIDCLFDELGRLSKERQEILETCEAMTEERGIMRQRIELLRALLTLEGTHVELPDGVP